jgi:hypothetical protein
VLALLSGAVDSGVMDALRTKPTSQELADVTGVDKGSIAALVEPVFLSRCRSSRCAAGDAPSLETRWLPVYALVVSQPHGHSSRCRYFWHSCVVRERVTRERAKATKSWTRTA